MGQRGVLGLTSRQECYLRGMCRGGRRKDVAALEGVSDHTVRVTLNAVYRALKVRSIAAACYRLGMSERRDVCEVASDG